MTRDEAMDALEAAARDIAQMRRDLEWTDAEERELIRFEQQIETFVADASEDYEDEL